MKYKTLLIDTLREIRRTKSRFLSIAAIIALGTGFFCGIKVTCPNMLQTADAYYDSLALSDFHLISTYGITEDDVSDIQKMEGIAKAEPGYSKDVFMVNTAGTKSVIKLLSLPKNPDEALNQVNLLEGRMPQNSTECLIEKTLTTPKNLKLGEPTTFLVGKEDEEMEDFFQSASCTPVGIVTSPRYVNFERGSSLIGNGTITSYVLMLEDNFAYEYYTDLYIALDKDQKLSAFSKEYEALIEQFQTILEDKADVRSIIRYDEIYLEAMDKITEAKQDLKEGKETAERELRDASRKLDDAAKDLADGKQTQQKEIAKAKQELADAKIKLEDGKKEYDENLLTYEKEIADAKAKIEDGELTIAYNERRLARSKETLANGKAELAKAEKEAIPQLKAAQAQLDAEKALFIPLLDANKTLVAMMAIPPAELQAMDEPARLTYKRTVSALASGVDAGLTAIPMPTPITTDLATTSVSMLQAFFDDISDPSAEIAAYATQQQIANGIIAEVEKTFATAQSQIDQSYAQFDSAWDQLRLGALQLRDGEQQLEEGRKELAKGKIELEEQIVEAETKFADARKELADGAVKLADGEKTLAEETVKSDKEIRDGEVKLKDAQVKFADAKKDVEEELADGTVKIDDAEKELAKLEIPKWYVWDRTNQPGYDSYSEDAERVDKIAVVFPVFFILVAALICLTTMSRMVEEQRTQIGVMKALGYGKGAIMSKYLLYALLASLLGCAIGLSVGFSLFPKIIFDAYSIMYILPPIVTPFVWSMAGLSVLTAVLCTTTSAYFACRSGLVAQPSQLMRPKAPKSGKRNILERIRFFWEPLSFNMKVTIRNLLRYKSRVLMTVVGIGGCTALMLTGFGLQYSISSILDKQFEEIFHYDALGAIEDNLTSTEMQSITTYLNEQPLLEQHMFIYQKNVAVQAPNTTRSVYLFIPTLPNEIDQFIDFHTRTTQTPLSLSDDGVIINEKLAKLLQVGVGDTFTLNDQEMKAEVLVSAICENYTMNYVYMSPAYYQEVFQTSSDINMFIANMHENTAETRESLSNALIEHENVLGVSWSADNGKKFADMMDSLNVIVLVLILCAGALAFVVLYNLTNINVNERLRELATIKVLGFYDREVSSYIYRENTISAILGIFAGLLMGIVLHAFVIQTAEVEMVMFNPHINAASFISASLLTLLFTCIVNIVLHFRLKKIDMVESLKSVE